MKAALAGRYGAATRPTRGQRSLTLNSAVPIRRGDSVVGAVLVSQSTFRILQALYDVRLRIFQVVVASVLAAALLSVLVSATIVRPLDRLRRQAFVLANRRGRLPGAFHGTDRPDEIGDLARALEELARHQDEHIQLLESFAADVSHEFKNPLAGIRTAAEMLAEARVPDDRARFLEMLTRDVDRLERLVSGVREIARIDAQIEQESSTGIDVVTLLSQVVAGVRLAGRAPVELVLHHDGAPCIVRASPDCLAQAFENVLANARSFAPAGTAVDVVIEGSDTLCCVTIADRGPGIPETHLDRVFDRFFTYRPDEAHGRRDHTGLGLAIARAIVHGYGGTITAGNRAGGGACFEIRLPVVTKTDGLR